MTIIVQRRNMVEQQIRTWDVLDDRVLDLYYELHRDHFLPRHATALAFADTQAPIGHDQVCLEPKVEARMLQELAPQPNEKILHIGTGSGIFAALLSKLCARVVSVEINPQLAELAASNLALHNINNVTVVTEDFFALTKLADGPFDAIVLTGSVPAVTPAMLTQLGDHGRGVIPIGVDLVSTVTLLRLVDGATTTQDLFDTWIPPLQNVSRPSAFAF